MCVCCSFHYIYPLDLHISPQALATLPIPEQLIHFCLQSSTTCMEKSTKHGNMDKTQKITLIN